MGWRTFWHWFTHPIILLSMQYHAPQSAHRLVSNVVLIVGYCDNFAEYPPRSKSISTAGSSSRCGFYNKRLIHFNCSTKCLVIFPWYFICRTRTPNLLKKVRWQRITYHHVNNFFCPIRLSWQINCTFFPHSKSRKAWPATFPVVGKLSK
jgi:hypothetical protein